jgi:hypothetical protein
MESLSTESNGILIPLCVSILYRRHSISIEYEAVLVVKTSARVDNEENAIMICYRFVARNLMSAKISLICALHFPVSRLYLDIKYALKLFLHRPPASAVQFRYKLMRLPNCWCYPLSSLDLTARP